MPLKTWRETLRLRLVEEPSYISLMLRWFGWIVALTIVLLGSAPELNLDQAPLVLVVTFVELALMSIYPKHIRTRTGEQMARRMPALWPACDILIAVWAIYATGGWDSPFYHFGVTVVLGPSLHFGLLGALISSSVYSALYLVAVKASTPGFETAAGPDLVSTPLNPLMISLYAAFLGEVLKQLRREMERSTLLAAENERARMARDIHDGVSQTLFMLSMSLETGQVLAGKEGAPKTAEHLAKLTPVAKKALIELRNAMYDVEPLAAGRQTLEQAVEQLTRDYRSATGRNVEFLREDGFESPQALASTLFRLTTEALSNACQHSGAEVVRVELNGSSLCVSDDGKGFDPAKIKRGRGLSNLEQRARESGIDYSLETNENGTRCLFRWEEEKR